MFIEKQNQLLVFPDHASGANLLIRINVLELFRVALFYSVAGQSNSNSDTCAEFRVKYVGAIEKLKHNESKNLEGPLDLINYIDVAQVSALQKNTNNVRTS